MFYRDFTRDDPVSDANRAMDDDRPVIGTCESCGEDIHGMDESEEGDGHWNIDGCMYCENCGIQHLREEYYVRGDMV